MTARRTVATLLGLAVLAACLILAGVALYGRLLGTEELTSKAI